jgi:hypothetical protein
MDVLNASGDTRDFDQVAADMSSHVGQVWDSGDGPDLRLSLTPVCRKDEHDRE